MSTHFTQFWYVRLMGILHIILTSTKKCKDNIKLGKQVDFSKHSLIKIDCTQVGTKNKGFTTAKKQNDYIKGNLSLHDMKIILVYQN